MVGPHQPAPLLPILKQTAEIYFQCPGEDYPVSKAVHLSRLAAFYPKCRECPHREETGNLSQQTIKRLGQIQKQRVSQQSLFMEEGVRGVYLNEINRTQAAHIAGAFSNILWESLPLKGLAPQKPADHLVKTKSRPEHNSYSEKSRGPNVVIGFDERSSSPDIVTGVASVLRRNGCRVIDLGLTVPAVMSYAMTHLQAQGAIMVTGSQCGPSYTGLEFLQEHSLPVSANHGLEQIEERARTGFGRASRQPGSQRTFHPLESYRAQFGKHFHALRPLKISIACSLRLVRETLNTLFEKLPCQLSWIEIPNQKRDLLNPLDIDVLKMNQSLQAGDFDLGIIIDDDSRRCAFFDETGALLSQHLISWFLMKALAAEHTNQIFLLDQESQELLPEIPPGWDVSQHDGTLADSYMQMQNKQAVYAGSHTGYHWFRETVPTCDAILTLAHVLAALSFSDAPFSEALSQ
ncbi:hypothetical protein [Gimesia aquarii]|uniref:Phosphomannomutase/phosphoglucomutase n=1 Tax=Gimesia aquarii TaxID=2527964 RepID=A0A517WRN0_9PLAN|nr:hypothetical protein [Gimesia aquarii]QDU07914.1 Phosphomannomutase/phosphoglucomutase [Gimesia aquarii]